MSSQYLEIARCRREIAEIEASIRAGHPDVQGLCLALADWSAELRILQNAQSLLASTRRREGGGKRRDLSLDAEAPYPPSTLVDSTVRPIFLLWNR